MSGKSQFNVSHPSWEDLKDAADELFHAHHARNCSEVSWLFWGCSAQPERVWDDPDNEIIGEVRARLVLHRPEKSEEDFCGSLLLF